MQCNTTNNNMQTLTNCGAARVPSGDVVACGWWWGNPTLAVWFLHARHGRRAPCRILQLIMCYCVRRQSGGCGDNTHPAHTHIRTHRHALIHEYIYTHTYTVTYTHACTDTYTDTGTYTYRYTATTTSTYTTTDTYAYTYSKHTHTDTRTNTYTNTHHTHIHIHNH